MNLLFLECVGIEMTLKEPHSLQSTPPPPTPSIFVVERAVLGGLGVWWPPLVFPQIEYCERVCGFSTLLYLTTRKPEIRSASDWIRPQLFQLGRSSRFCIRVVCNQVVIGSGHERQSWLTYDSAWNVWHETIPTYVGIRAMSHSTSVLGKHISEPPNSSPSQTWTPRHNMRSSPSHRLHSWSSHHRAPKIVTCNTWLNKLIFSSLIIIQPVVFNRSQTII